MWSVLLVFGVGAAEGWGRKELANEWDGMTRWVGGDASCRLEACETARNARAKAACWMAHGMHVSQWDACFEPKIEMIAFDVTLIPECDALTSAMIAHCPELHAKTPNAIVHQFRNSHRLRKCLEKMEKPHTHPTKSKSQKGHVERKRDEYKRDENYEVCVSFMQAGHLDLVKDKKWLKLTRPGIPVCDQLIAEARQGCTDSHLIGNMYKCYAHAHPDAMFTWNWCLAPAISFT